MQGHCPDGSGIRAVDPAGSQIPARQESPGIRGLPEYPAAHCSQRLPIYPGGQSQVGRPSELRWHVRANLREI